MGPASVGQDDPGTGDHISQARPLGLDERAESLRCLDHRHGARSAITWRDAAVIGVMQVLSIVPGTSRSGITLTAALLLGMTRAAGARFSFLLSIPTIAGAGLLLANDAIAEGHTARIEHLLVGAALSGVAAYGCIRIFITLIDRTGMLPYVIYRILLGVVLLALWSGLFG